MPSFQDLVPYPYAFRQTDKLLLKAKLFVEKIFRHQETEIQSFLITAFHFSLHNFAISSYNS